MKIDFTINGINAYSTFKIFINEDSYNSIIQFPALKEVATISWPDKNGVDADLSSPKLNSREITIDFVSLDPSLYPNFLEEIQSKQIHTFYFAAIGKTMRLRPISASDVTKFVRITKFAITFADDEPLFNYTYKLPTRTNKRNTGLKMDGKDLANYGLCVLEGSLESITRMPDIKQRYIESSTQIHGAIYGGQKLEFKYPTTEEEEDTEEETAPAAEPVIIEAKKAEINCLLLSNSTEEFWQNYNALLFDLIRPGARELQIGQTNKSYYFYYNNNEVTQTEILTKNRIWCVFKINITLI